MRPHLVSDAAANPCSTAQPAICAREVKPSFWRMCLTCSRARGGYVLSLRLRARGR